MIERSLFPIAFAKTWGRQMRWITGPRQSGKTTLAKLQLQRARTSALYYLWDLRAVRNRYKANQLFFTEDAPPGRVPHWVCFDEIHKIPKWKNALKAMFDATAERYRFIVTGSAKFDVRKKAGDSLSGRFFTFRLFPLSLHELCHTSIATVKPPTTAHAFLQHQMDTSRYATDALTALLTFGGFPEPLVRHSTVFLAKWADDYADTVIKEDIGALTRIIDKEHLYDLYNLLPRMVGSPISVASLAAHLELSHPTIKNYLRRLEDFYLAFRIHPYAKNIKRAMLKAPKCYLYDWTRIHDQSTRFENYVAMELLLQIHLWMACSADRYRLCYIRNRQKEETDFLLLKNDAPWLLVEAKLSDGPIASHHYKMQAALKHIPIVQVCREERVCLRERTKGLRISASRLFA